MNKKQIEFVKHCGEHFEVLTGGRGHSKTKQIIEQLEKQKIQLENNWNELKKWLEEEKGQYGKDNRCWYESVLDKMQELEGNNE